MLNEKIYPLVKESILSDRNMKAGNVSEVKISKAFIELTIEDNADKIKIKRETKENLKTYWNITMMNNEHIAEFVKDNHITFTEFRKEFEDLTKDIHGDLDLENCVEEALKNLAEQKITSNISRSEKRNNSNKKAEEIHGKDSEPLTLPEGKTNEPLTLTDGRSEEEIPEAEKVDEIEEAEEVTGDPREEFLTAEEIKETQGEKQYSEEEKKELVLNFIEEKAPFTYKVGDIADNIGIDSTEITEITLSLLKENKIIMEKKGRSGKQGIYGSILVVTEA